MRSISRLPLTLTIAVMAVALGIYLYPYWQGHGIVREFKVERGLFTPKTLKPYRALVIKSEADRKVLVEGLKSSMEPYWGIDDHWLALCGTFDKASAGVDFTREAILLIPHTAGSGSIEVGLSRPRLYSKKLVLEIWRTRPWVLTCDMAYHCFAVIVPRESVSEVVIRSLRHEETLDLESDPQEYVQEYRRR